MSKPRKEDQDIEEAKRIMERLVNTPHKPHQPKGQASGKSATAKKNQTVKGKSTTS